MNWLKSISLALLSSSLVHAAPITWGPATNVSGDSDVSTNGLLVEAINAAADSVSFTRAVNGVPFVSDSVLSGSFDGDFLTTSLPGITGGYERLLSNADLGGGQSPTIEIGDGQLISGEDYEVQVWFVDTRNAVLEQNRVMTISGGTGDSVGLTGNPGQFATGTFTADGSSQDLLLETSGFGNAHINAYQVRRLISALEVTTLTDELDDPGTTGSGLSLREAIRDSESGGLIFFNPSLDGGMVQLNPNLGELRIDKSLTVDASNLPNGIIIDGGSNGDDTVDEDEVRCFRINDGDPNRNSLVILSHLTIQNGAGSGGGGNIQVSEDLTLQNCKILKGIEGGIATDGSSRTRRTITITSCTFDGNRTRSSGGAISASGQKVTLTDCTLSRNHSDGQGSALLFSDVEGLLERCTIVGNTGGRSPLRIGNGDMRLSHCTIVGNRDDDQASGAIELTNVTCTLEASIVRDNIGGDLFDGSSGIFVSEGGHNLIGTGNDLSAFSASEISSAPILLAPLANYGGLTETMPPLPGSPVINAIEVQKAPENFRDQRGLPVLTFPDIGAVEFQGEEEELRLALQTDGDQDGLSVGLELFIGSDPFVADFDHPGRPRMELLNGNPTLILGRTVTPLVLNLSVQRSETLLSGSFTRIAGIIQGRIPGFDPSINIFSPPGDIEIEASENRITISDLIGAPRAFYRLSVSVSDGEG